MIQEIKNFMDTLKDDYFNNDINLKDEGLYVVIKTDENNIPMIGEYPSILYRKKETENHSEFISLYNLRMKEYYSDCISANKYLDTGSGGKKIHSSIPYAIWFKKGNIDNIEDRLDYYFDETIALINNDEKEINRINSVRDFCKERLLSLLKADKHIKDLKDNDYFKIFFNLGINEYRKSYNRYLSVKLFNKGDQGKEYGQAIFLNGAPDKKPYIIPKTAIFETNLKVSKTIALQLEKFRRLLTNKPNKKLPNPLPIFIDKDELNNEVIKLFNREGIRKFHEIIKSIFNNFSNDISDYYLINWFNTKDGLVISDVDYVSLFIYKLENFKIINVTGLRKNEEELERDISIENIFQFEQILDQNLFYRIQNNTGFRYGSLINHYFSNDPAPPKGYNIRAIVKRNLLRYRKAIYDYIYKSRTEAITSNMLYDIIISTVIDDIKTDHKFTNTKHIQEKLNILFSINKNFGGNDMASKIPQFQENMRKLFNNDDYHIQTDEEFAFESGQLIYYILTKSQTLAKTHALLEPYITKNDPLLFKQTITRGIEQYKHAFDFGNRKFEKLSSEILGYDCSKGIKELLSLILAGYFSISIIFEKTNKQNKGE
jgi:CRISPR-associated protein Csh1